MSIPSFPILYKQTSKGKVSQWHVEIQPVASELGTFVPSAYNILVTFGEKDGKLQTHTTLITKGKVNRSVLEQAILEATSKFHEKKNRDTYREEINTPIVNVRPMLAYTFDPSIYHTHSRAYRIPFPAFIQPKLDGIRCMASLSENKVCLRTRNGVDIQLFEKLKNEIFSILYRDGEKNQSIYFDGELYTNQLNFEVINGLVRQTKQSENTQLQDLVEFHIYDLYDTLSPNMSFQERKEILDDFSIRYFHNIRIVVTEIANEITDVKRYHDVYIQQEYEGIIIRDMNGSYEVNKRSKYLQKYKEFLEAEFIIVGYSEGVGIDCGLIIFKCVTGDGKEFCVKPRGSHEYRRQLFEKGADYIGHYLTVIFQEYSNEGIPRFPVGKAIRYDNNIMITT